MQEPQEIQDEEHEQLLDRVAAIDVAKASGMVCTRVLHPSGGKRRLTRVWEVAATTTSIMELADHLVKARIERVTVESTSDYWRGFFYLLEARGLDVALVNAREVKNVPGRPRPTSWTRSGWPSSPNGACCGPRSCRRSRSGCCATTPGCAPT